MDSFFSAPRSYEALHLVHYFLDTYGAQAVGQRTLWMQRVVWQIALVRKPTERLK